MISHFTKYDIYALQIMIFNVLLNMIFISMFHGICLVVVIFTYCYLSVMFQWCDISAGTAHPGAVPYRDMYTPSRGSYT